MNWSYAYGPFIWPALLSAVLVGALGWYSWRRRNIPGTRPFAVASVFAVLWIIGLILEGSATEPSTKTFWFAFQGIWQVPLATAITCFILQYAGLGRWLTRRNLFLLSIPSILIMLLIFTNGLHYTMWQGFVVDEAVKPVRGSTYWIGFVFGYSLALANIIILIWLFIRSPRYRWPVTLMLIAEIFSRIFYALDITKLAFLEPLSPIFFMFAVSFAIYAIALFHFHAFDPVPLARVVLLDQMREGMLVLDLQGRIVDLNSTAAKILGSPVSGLRGRIAEELLSTNPAFLANPDKMRMTQSEISLMSGNAARHYNLDLTPLTDRRGELLGQLLLLHDVTEQKRAQSHILEQQSVVATLQERERLARELHDGVGQVLGFIGLQAQIIRKLVREGKTEQTEPEFARLLEVARDAHADVRESILNLKAGANREWSFVPALKQYLTDFQSQNGIHTELLLPDGLKENTFEPAAGIQLLRVIQEALTNARKHSQARTVKVAIELQGYRARINISDDGVGFKTDLLKQDHSRHFGLTFMRERMEQIDGSITIDSRPGAGTIVKLDTPVWSPEENIT